MLKVQIALIAILIASVAFVSCERMQKMLEPAADDMMDTGDMMSAGDRLAEMMAMTTYRLWTSVALPVPPATVTAPAESGGAHGMGTRTVYISDAGVMALKDASMTTFPEGTLIIKEIMDETNTFLMRVAAMEKTADPMYAAHNGWKYTQYQRESATAGLMPQAGDIPGGSSDGCHGCHVKADNDSVFVSLPMDDMEDTDDMMGMMMDMMDSTMYMSWASVALPAPTMTVAEAAAALNAAGTGAAHGEGTRTAYINDIGTTANMEGTAYLAGTMIVKTIMDDANTFVAKKALMTKTDDPMYADHNGWMYVKYARASETDDYMMVGGGSLEGSMGCHGCHAKASNDSVFVSLSMKEDVTPETPDADAGADDADTGAGNGGAADDGDANGGDAQ
jgi:hypothetical protein